MAQLERHPAVKRPTNKKRAVEDYDASDSPPQTLILAEILMIVPKK
jgi:hypothetical protein